MTPVVSEICEECQFFLGFKRGLKIPVCKAFPDGIPREICEGGNDHHKPVKGDHGIQYKGREDAS